MVEQRAPVSRSEPPLGRPRPPRSRIVARRIVALVVLALGLSALVALAAIAVGSIRDGGTKKAPTVAAAPAPLRIIFPEGFTRAEMADRIEAVDAIARERRKISPRLSAKAYLKASASSKLPGRFARDGGRRPLEGFLFPATYEFTATTTSKQLVARQLVSFDRNWRKVDLAYAKSRNLTPYDVLIIASMVEKEVIAPEERALVAAVIYNRLHDGMKLQIDATTRYGLHVPADEPLRDSQLHSKNPYNTREVPGLPPTPIANPGLASIQAAAHPADVDYLFFVRKPDKIHHFFTASESEFENYKNQHGYG